MASEPFVFGKLPSHGDFVTAGLDAVSQDRWDDFGVRLIARARACWGEAFGQRHAEAPMWRFSLAAGTMMDAACVGALAASTDAAGRQFIFVAGVCGSDDADVAQRIEDLVWQAMVDTWPVMRLSEALGGLEAGPGRLPPAPWWTACGDQLADEAAFDSLLCRIPKLEEHRP